MKIDNPYDIATSLLELYSTETSPCALTGMGKNVHAVLFLILKNLGNLNIYHSQMDLKMVIFIQWNTTDSRARK